MQAEQARAGALIMAGRYAEAEAVFRDLLASAPEDAILRHSLAIALLGQGRLREGYRLYRGRTQIPRLGVRRPQVACPEWNGEPVAGRHILLFPEQGAGDQIQMARFAPVLREMGADVTLFCAPSLARLFEALGVRVIAAMGEAEFPEPDAWALAMDLPGKLGVELDGIPNARYLRGAPRPAGARIGAFTHGDPRHPNDANRSLPPELALPFEHLSLRPEDTGVKDFQDTADVVAGLDLVVTVDSSVAHLAGAMGKPTFLLLPAMGCDWRWMSGRADTPWYPSMRLFRQPAPGDWNSVLAAVAQALPASLRR